MKFHQQDTYVLYNRGILPENMRLGSLYVDPGGPLDGERKCCAIDLDPDQLSQWTDQEELEDSQELVIKASSDWLQAAGLSNALRVTKEVRIRGEHSRRVQINRPDSFLNEVHLASPTSRQWLATQLAIIRQWSLREALPHLGKLPPPRIWLTTGVHYMTNPQLAGDTSGLSKTSLSATVPVIGENVYGKPAVLTGTLGPSREVSGNKAAGTNTPCHHADERVWAVQFMPVDLNFIDNSAADADLNLRRQILLHDSVQLNPNGRSRFISPLQKYITAELSIPKAVEKNPINEEMVKRMQDLDPCLLDRYMDCHERTWQISLTS